MYQSFRSQCSKDGASKDTVMLLSMIQTVNYFVSSSYLCITVDSSGIFLRFLVYTNYFFESRPLSFSDGSILIGSLKCLKNENSLESSVLFLTILPYFSDMFLCCKSCNFKFKFLEFAMDIAHEVALVDRIDERSR